MINARVESVADKPAFARALAVAALPGAGPGLVRVAGLADRARPQGQAAQAAVLHLPGRRHERRDGRPLRVLARPRGRATPTTRSPG